MSFDDERAGHEPLHDDLADTVTDAPPVHSPSDIREMMDKIARGQPVPKSELMCELERMFRLVARTDADFESVVVAIQRRTPMTWDPDVIDSAVLLDGTVLLQTPWPISSCDVLPAELRAREDWIEAHRDPRGVPCFRLSFYERAQRARSYAELVKTLGADVVWLPIG